MTDTSDTISIQADDYDLTRRLKATLLQYVKLYERWSEDRQEWTKALTKVEEVNDRFEASVDKFGEVDEKFRKALRDFIRQETQDAAQSIADSLKDSVNELKESISKAVKTVKEDIREATSEEVKNATMQLTQAVNQAEARVNKIVNAYQKDLSLQFWSTIAVSLIVSLVSSMAIMMITFHRVKPTLPLTANQIKYLDAGISFSNIWPKLTKAERDHLDALKSGNN
jgi:hypothetical protein